MKKVIITLFVAFYAIATAFAQTTISSEHFIYEYKDKQGMVIVKPKDRVDTTLAKEEGLWKLDHQKLNWRDIRRSTFQELINQNIISSDRIKELANAKEKIRIEVHFDETGVISYVYFTYYKNNGTLLTDNELYQISQAYLGKVYSVEGAAEVWQYDKVPPRKLTIFRGEDSFYIPFEELVY